MTSTHPWGNPLEHVHLRNDAETEAAFTDIMFDVEGSTDMALALTREVIADHKRAARWEKWRRIFPALFAGSAAMMPPQRWNGRFTP